MTIIMPRPSCITVSSFESESLIFLMKKNK